MRKGDAMKLIKKGESFEILWGNRVILRHSKEKPFLTLGNGSASYSMGRGTFKIKDRLKEKITPKEYNVISDTDSTEIACECQDYDFRVIIREDGDRLTVSFEGNTERFNRLMIRFPSATNEHIYGCGEQFTEFDLKGKKVKVWVSEHQQFKSLVMKVLKRKMGGRKDRVKSFGHYTTYYCSPSFISSEKYFLHVDDAYYMEFDFTRYENHELYIYGIPKRIMIVRAENFEGLMGMLTELTGRMADLPPWVYNGAILGIQGGTENVRHKLKKSLDKEVRVSAVWCQDWEGSRMTSFGKQLMWNWRWDEKLYPGLDEEIKSMNEKGIRFLGYINPFLAVEGDLYREASSKGYTVKDRSGKEYLVKITTFPAAMVDLTNPCAFSWIKEVIKANMIGIGLSGWMADFGEYLPADAVLYAGKSSEGFHNIWPVLWAKANSEAVYEAGKRGEILVFMRSGFFETPKYAPLVWNGDQHVDWSMDYGLPSVIPAMLSLSMSGCGISHSDIGGYTTLPGINREKELFMRWAELSAFTPVMRTHEGNRPDDNWQFDSDDETIKHFARMTRIHNVLAPYLKELVVQNSEKGIPMVRPLFMYYNDELNYVQKYEYLLGRDLLISPVLKEGLASWKAYLPEDEWIHLWSGSRYFGGEIEVESQIGYPPIFYRASSIYGELFKSILKL